MKIVSKIEKLLVKIDEAKKANEEVAEELKALSASILNKAFKKEEKRFSESNNCSNEKNLKAVRQLTLA